MDVHPVLPVKLKNRNLSFLRSARMDNLWKTHIWAPYSNSPSLDRLPTLTTPSISANLAIR